MRPFVLSQLPIEDIDIFKKIRYAVENFPDEFNLGSYSNGKPVVLSCHMLARAIGKVFDLEWRDGYFHPFYEHSWLVTSHGNVIDVYPVGILGGPILVHQTGNFTSPVKHLYEPVYKFLGEREREPHFVAAVSVVEEQIQKIVTAHQLL